MSINSYQERVEQWLEACFPPEVRADRGERTHRFLEEALELAQANGCSRSDALALVDYVFGRAQGDAVQEVGGVMVTLASLCSATRWPEAHIVPPRHRRISPSLPSRGLGSPAPLRIGRIQFWLR